MEAFTSGFMVRPTGGGADFYRPAIILSLLFDKSVWGSNSAGFHATNLVLHTMSVLLVGQFAWLVLRSRAAAIAAAFLFAVHPVHTESVCWISGRTDLLCTAFLMGSANLFLAHRSKPKRLMLTGSYVLAALALISKELAATIPALIGLSAWAAGQQAGERGWKRIAVQALPFAGIVLVYGVVRTLVLYGTEPLSQSLSLLHQAATIAYSLFTHFQILLLPHTAHLSYEVVMQEIANTTTFAMVLSLAVLTWFLWSNRKSAPIPLFGMLWFLVTILPVSLLAGTELSTIVSQRFLYLPSVGLAVVFGWAVAQAVQSRIAIRAAGIAAAVVIVAALSVLSVGQSGLWANEVAYWEEFTRDTPTIGWSYYHLGLAYYRAGEYDRAVRLHEAAAELMPDQPEPEYGMAEAYRAQDDLDRAIEHYSNAVRLQPGDPTVRERLDEVLDMKSASSDSTARD